MFDISAVSPKGVLQTKHEWANEILKNFRVPFLASFFGQAENEGVDR